MEPSVTSVPPEGDSPPPAPLFLEPWRAVILLLGICVLYVVGDGVLFASTMNFALVAGLAPFLIQMFNMAPVAILTLAALKLPPRKTLGLSKPPPVLLLGVAAFAVCNMLFMIKLNGLVLENIFTPTEIFEQYRMLLMSFLGSADTPFEGFLLFLVMVIGAPVAEELFFRGFMQNVLVRVWKPWVGVLVTVIIFTIVHALPVRFFVVLELGLILGLLYHRTGSLVLVIMFHAASNFTGFAMGKSEWWANWAGTSMAFIVGVVGTLLLGFLICRAIGGTPHPDRSLRPERMRWFRVLFRLIPLWAVAIALLFTSSFFTSEGARQLKNDDTALTQHILGITGRFQTIPALTGFQDAVSEARGAVKQGHATSEELIEFLSDAETRIDAEAPRAPADASADAATHSGMKTVDEEPLPWEKDYFTWVRQQIQQRFGVEIPAPQYDD